MRKQFKLGRRNFIASVEATVEKNMVSLYPPKAVRSPEEKVELDDASTDHELALKQDNPGWCYGCSPDNCPGCKTDCSCCGL